MKKLTFIMIMVALVFFAADMSGLEKKVVDKVFKPVRQVSLKVVSGDCVIKKGADNEIRVHVEYTYPADKFKPVFVEAGDKLELKEDFSRTSGNFEGESSWTVTVPSKTNIDMTSASGNLTLNGIAASINISMAAGDITGADLNGAISVRTASGDITFQNISGSINVQCASGDITLENTELTGASKFNAVSGDLSISLSKTPAVNVDISTVSGSASLKYNGNPIKGSFQFKGMSGNINADVPFKNQEGSKFSPFVNKTYENAPTPKISMQTVSGNLELKK